MKIVLLGMGVLFLLAGVFKVVLSDGMPSEIFLGAMDAALGISILVVNCYPTKTRKYNTDNLEISSNDINLGNKYQVVSIINKLIKYLFYIWFPLCFFLSFIFGYKEAVGYIMIFGAIFLASIMFVLDCVRAYASKR